MKCDWLEFVMLCCWLFDGDVVWFLVEKVIWYWERVRVGIVFSGRFSGVLRWSGKGVLG